MDDAFDEISEEISEEKFHLCADGHVYVIESKREMITERVTENGIYLLSEFEGHRVVRILSRNSRNVGLTSDGFLWTWGEKPLGPLFKTSRPTRAFRVLDVALGYQHLLVLGTDGRVISLGENLNGQLGRSTTATFDNEFGSVTLPSCGDESPWIGVAAGFVHSFVWTKKEIYGFGGNKGYQLGLRNNCVLGPDCPIPTRIDVFVEKNIQDVQAGAFFSAVLSSGCLYVFGTFCQSRTSSLIHTTEKVYVCGAIVDNVGDSLFEYYIPSSKSLFLWDLSNSDRNPSSIFSTRRVSFFDTAKSVNLLLRPGPRREYWFFSNQRDVESFTDEDPVRIKTVSVILRVLSSQNFSDLFIDGLEFLSYITA